MSMLQVRNIEEPSNAALLATLIGRVANRDNAALAELYDKTVAKVFAMARRILRDRCDAEDLVVDVYERAWQQAASYDPSRGSVLGWLLIMCRSRALDQLRQRKARAGAARALAQEAADDQVEELPATLLDEWQRGHRVTKALAELAPVRQRLVTLAFFEGLSHHEIAARVNMPLGTVKSHVRRALLELRAALGVQGELE